MGRKLATVILLFALVAAGCRRGGRVDPLLQRPDLVPATTPLVADLPVPWGFRLVESLSSEPDHAPAGPRTQVYLGHDPAVLVERFYEKQLPAAGWQVTQSNRDGTRLRIDATKDGRSLSMAVSPWEAQEGATLVVAEIADITDTAPMGAGNH